MLINIRNLTLWTAFIILFLAQSQIRRNYKYLIILALKMRLLGCLIKDLLMIVKCKLKKIYQLMFIKVYQSHQESKTGSH